MGRLGAIYRVGDAVGFGEKRQGAAAKPGGTSRCRRPREASWSAAALCRFSTRRLPRSDSSSRTQANFDGADDDAVVTSFMRVLIVGCGYVGTPLGAALVKQGHEVFGLRRRPSADEALAAAGIKPLVANITRLEELTRLPAAFDWVVNCVSSSGGGVDEYRSVYLQGTRHLLEWLTAAPPKKF